MNGIPRPIWAIYDFHLENFQKNRIRFLALGILHIVAGVLAIFLNIAVAIVSVFLLGWVLMVAGAFEVIQSFWQHKWGGFFLHFVVGIFAVVVGFHFVGSPTAGELALTIVMAIYFIVVGILRMVTALVLRFPNWGWMLLSGLISLALGFLIEIQWPYSGLVAIGLFIGIDLLSSGVSYVLLSVAAGK